MTSILIIFSISLVLSLLFLLNKHKEDVGGKGYVCIGSERTDIGIVNGYKTFLDLVHRATISTAKLYIQKSTVWFEKQFIRLTHYTVKRVYSFSNIITGHNIPKNKGSVSFFLKNIEEHKKTVSGR